MAYWRQRFLLDSTGWAKGALATEHSMYQAQVKGVAINPLAPPWVEASALWTAPWTAPKHSTLGGLARDARPGDVFERSGAV